MLTIRLGRATMPAGGCRQYSRTPYRPRALVADLPAGRRQPRGRRNASDAHHRGTTQHSRCIERTLLLRRRPAVGTVLGWARKPLGAVLPQRRPALGAILPGRRPAFGAVLPGTQPALGAVPPRRWPVQVRRRKGRVAADPLPTTPAVIDRGTVFGHLAPPRAAANGHRCGPPALCGHLVKRVREGSGDAAPGTRGGFGGEVGVVLTRGPGYARGVNKVPFLTPQSKMGSRSRLRLSSKKPGVPETSSTPSQSRPAASPFGAGVTTGPKKATCRPSGPGAWMTGVPTS